jgi:hypothetical protein
MYRQDQRNCLQSCSLELKLVCKNLSDVFDMTSAFIVLVIEISPLLAYEIELRCLCQSTVLDSVLVLCSHGVCSKIRETQSVLWNIRLVLY